MNMDFFMSLASNRDALDISPSPPTVRGLATLFRLLVALQYLVPNAITCRQQFLLRTSYIATINLVTVSKLYRMSTSVSAASQKISCRFKREKVSCLATTTRSGACFLQRSLSRWLFRAGSAKYTIAMQNDQSHGECFSCSEWTTSRKGWGGRLPGPSR